jgi:hypothetical protein
MISGIKVQGAIMPGRQLAENRHNRQCLQLVRDKLNCDHSGQLICRFDRTSLINQHQVAERSFPCSEASSQQLPYKLKFTMAAENAAPDYLKDLKLPKTIGGSVKLNHSRIQQLVCASGIWNIIKHYDGKRDGHLIAQLLIEKAFGKQFILDYNNHGTAVSFRLLKSTYFPVKDTPGAGYSEEMRSILFSPAARLFMRGLAKAVRPNSVRKWSLFYGLIQSYSKGVFPT